MLISEHKVEVCDATEADSSNAVGTIKKPSIMKAL